MLRHVKIALMVFSIGFVLLLQPQVIAPAHADDSGGKIIDSDCQQAPKYPLPQPSALPQAQYQNFDVTLYNFLNCGNYYLPGWSRDKAVRNTGPWVDGKYYGTHPAVRIHYSPQVIAWLKAGRRGTIPDGAMIIKEQYQPPAARYEGLDEQQLKQAFKTSGKDWTVMIRDSKGSADGWYWAEVYSGMLPDRSNAYQAPYNYPNGGFGHYCMRCHASAKDQHTFSSLSNIAGFPNDPLTFMSDYSWLPKNQASTGTAAPAVAAGTAASTSAPVSSASTATPTKAPALAAASASSKAQARPKSIVALPDLSGTEPYSHRPHGHSARYRPPASQRAVDASTANNFASLFPSILTRPVQAMVGETFDRIPATPKRATSYVSSDQCLLCHGGANSGLQQAMVLPIPNPDPNGDPVINVSPYGEWRWSPMGLAGRDPVFYAQLESELAYIKTLPDKKTAQSLHDTTVNTCFRCHGVMGKRQWDQDHQCDPTNPQKPCDPANPARPQFKPEFTQITDSADPHFKYGALARDGISCQACHRQKPSVPPDKNTNPLEYFLKNSITGLFQTLPPDKLTGPFEDVATTPMKHTLGITPEHNAYLKSSRMCGSCHSIYLPVIDKPPIKPVGPQTAHNMEQATYLEWLNSKYQNEIPPFAACNPKDPFAACARSCQGCHMSTDFVDAAKKMAVDPIATKIATIQDQDMPAAEGLIPAKERFVPRRTSGYARHELLGMNVFLLEMFKQNSSLLGVRTTDYMTGNKYDLNQTIHNLTAQSRERSARISAEITSAKRGSNSTELEAKVTVSNMAGHRLPSGVGFRRAFIEFTVQDTSGKTLWASGRSNDLGVILGPDGKPLPSEFFDKYTGPDGKPRQHYQPHYQEISRQDQVQIYEELVQNADGQFTTSFLRRDHEVKDNRLLPVGWTEQGPAPKHFNGVYLEATHPKGNAKEDPDYRNGSGGDSLKYRVSLPASVDPKALSVRATLYYQSIPPYFLAARFAGAPDGPATQRLYYLTSNLNLNDSPAKGWKMMLGSATVQGK